MVGGFGELLRRPAAVGGLSGVDDETVALPTSVT